ncbi:HUS1 checkpoint protein [Trypanosoma grayi]|uniref:HUS1 checkpoint protein n=1 Tax=Trypanosoma grayi TaxID=71804 RepID=UPI0004F4B932|nr:HUS1 checkpoint protein [Trypanosoma grayi]KEG08487.1 HUS1 checkpoint protein [Trypanosoma grayi]
MKFKATVRDQRTLAGVCQACRSIQQRCVVKLHPARVRFFTMAQATDGMQVWAGCRTESVFSDFQSQSRNADNAIYCEVADLARLVHILRQAERCPHVGVKLTSNAARRPALRVSLQGVLPHLDISHDVPVRVLSEAEVLSISAPPLTSEVLQLALPSLTELTLFVDKVRGTSCERMTFTAQGNARPPRSTAADGGGGATCSLVIEAECFLGSFALKYNAVPLCERDDDDEEEEEEEAEEGGDEKADGAVKNRDRKRRRREKDDAGMLHATVEVEVRRFARFLAIKEVTPLQVMLHLVDGKAVVLSVAAAGGTTLVGYMPALLH